MLVVELRNAFETYFARKCRLHNFRLNTLLVVDIIYHHHFVVIRSHCSSLHYLLLDCCRAQVMCGNARKICRKRCKQICRWRRTDSTF